MFITLFALLALLLASQVHGQSTPIATSPIVTVYVSTSYSVTSSITGTSTSTSTGEGYCTTNSAGSACVGGAIALSLVTLYGSSTATFTYPITSTIGYSTIYSDVSGASALDTASIATPQPTGSTAVPSTVTGVVAGSSTAQGTATSVRPASGSSSDLSSSPPSASSSAAGTNNADNTTATATATAGLSTGLKAAIGVAVGLAIVLGVVAAVFFVKRHRKNKVASPEVGDVVGSAYGKAELGDDSVLAKEPKTAVEMYGSTHAPWQAQETDGNMRYEAYGTQRHEMEAQAWPSAYELEASHKR